MKKIKTGILLAVTILAVLCTASVGNGGAGFYRDRGVSSAVTDTDTSTADIDMKASDGVSVARADDASGTAVDIPDGYTLDYSANAFDAVPDDFSLYDGCETGKTTTTFADGDMIIDNRSGSGAAATYYGALYEFATGRTYSDFIVNVKFKINDYADTGRFFSVMFHTAKADGKLKGYFVNYRMNGGSAVSCYDGASAHDTGNVNKGIVLTDGKYHTFTLALEGKSLKTYMDGTLIHDRSVTDRDTFLGGEMANGGFALMVSRSTMALSAIEIYRSSDYYVGNFSALPADWEAFSKSNVVHSTTRYENGEMIITDKDGAAGKYYGAVYRIATGYTFKNFDFAMTFRIIDFVDISRFIGVMFHNKMLADGNMQSYFVNMRMDGRSAPSAYASGGASDGAAVNVGVRIDDGKRHTLRITLIGAEVTHYIDGMKIATWDLSERSNKIPNIIEEGGFSVMVNKSTLALSSVSVTAVPRDDEFANANYDMKSGLVNGPTVVTDAVNASALDRALTAAVRPSDIIVRYGDDGNVIGADGSDMGSFYSVYKRLRGKIIPVVKIESAAAADGFISFMKNEFRIADISVASTDLAVVKKLRDALPWVRGMAFSDNADSPSELVAQLNINKATVAILPQHAATLDVVTYIQARFKTVWAVAESYRFADIYDCVNSGAYGVVSEHFSDVYDALATYDKKSVARASMNVAHRGCSNASYENSLSAVRIAIENGATHLELDGKLTTDGHIIIIHDDQVANTTTYTGTKTAEQMSLGELQSYPLQLRKSGDTSKRYLKDDDGNDIVEYLPSLDQVLELIKDTDVILVFEIKTDTNAIVPVLKTVAEKYGMLDKLIVISFSDADMIDTMYETMPSTPVAKLEGLGSDVWSMKNIGEVIQYLNGKNAALDKAYYTGGADAQFNRYLRDRGMIGWYWTFAQPSDVEIGEELGYLGITNNCAEIYAEKVRFVRGIEQSRSALSVGDSVEISVTDYSGNTVTADGEVFYLNRTYGGWKAIARYPTPLGYMYTQSFFVAEG